MVFFRKYGYTMLKLFLNQFGISLFGMALAFACSRAQRPKLMLATSIFAVLFYLFLEYAVMWEVGAKDGITAKARQTPRGLWRGFVISVCANTLNLICAFLVLTKVFAGGENPVSAVAQTIAMFLQGMYQGILSQWVGGVQLYTFPWMYFVIVVPAVLVCGVAYILGQYELHATNILIPKNKDVKNNGRPE